MDFQKYADMYSLVAGGKREEIEKVLKRHSIESLETIAINLSANMLTGIPEDVRDQHDWSYAPFHATVLDWYCGVMNKVFSQPSFFYDDFCEDVNQKAREDVKNWEDNIIFCLMNNDTPNNDRVIRDQNGKITGIFPILQYALSLN